MPEADLEHEKPVQEEIYDDRKNADHHRQITPVDRIERGRQNFDRRIGSQSDRVKLQRACSLMRGFGGESAMLVNHADDWLRQQDQSNGRRNGEQA